MDQSMVASMAGRAPALGLLAGCDHRRAPGTALGDASVGAFLEQLGQDAIEGLLVEAHVTRARQPAGGGGGARSGRAAAAAGHETEPACGRRGAARRAAAGCGGAAAGRGRRGAAAPTIQPRAGRRRAAPRPPPLPAATAGRSPALAATIGVPITP